MRGSWRREEFAGGARIQGAVKWATVSFVITFSFSVTGFCAVKSCLSVGLSELRIEPDSVSCIFFKRSQIGSMEWETKYLRPRVEHFAISDVGNVELAGSKVGRVPVVTRPRLPWQWLAR